MSKVILQAMLVVAVLVLSACANGADIKADVLATGSGLKTPVEAAGLLAGQSSQRPVQVLDVRTPEEFQAGCLRGAKNIDIRSGTFEQQIAALDKSATYLVYCRTGKRSADAAGRMKQAGFTNVMDLQGGFVAWGDSGNSVSQDCK